MVGADFCILLIILLFNCRARAQCYRTSTESEGILRYGSIETVAFKHYTPDPRANVRGRTRLPST
eukprot:SAG11_NODE_4210_length_2012_cov_2.055410_1_plen_64_part_10